MEVGPLCQTPICNMRSIGTHGKIGLTIPRFQLAFCRTGVHSSGRYESAIADRSRWSACCWRRATVRQPAPAAPKTDLDRFQGTWYLVMAMQDGKSLPEDKVKQTTIVFKGDTFHFPGSAEYATSKSGTIKLDETKTPKEMDAISTEKEVMLGIYVLQENGYKVCFAPAGKPRPTAIEFRPWEWLHPPGLGAGEEKLSRTAIVFNCICKSTARSGSFLF